VAYSAAVGRSHFTDRAAIVAADAQQARDALSALSRGEPHDAVRRGTVEPGQTPEVVFLFTGQGSQYVGMGRSLYDTSPVFRGVIDHCDGLLGTGPAGRSLRTVLFADPASDAAIHDTSWTQPALFAVEYALCQLWRSWGVEPAAVIGHSLGEYVAACVAGVFTLDEGLALVAERGRLMHGLPPEGAMAALFTSPDDVRRAIATMTDRVAIAAVNAPDSVVISGEAAAVDAVLGTLAVRGVEGHRLFISRAAHSPLVDPALDAMEACASRVAMRTPRLPVAWNVTGGEPLPGGAPDARYWRRHLREPVRFADGIGSLWRSGYRVFLEVGPHPTLIALAQRSLPEEGPVMLASMRRGREDWHELMDSLARLYVAGGAIDWPGLHRPYGRVRVALPSYPFERKTYWVPAASLGVRPATVPTASGLVGQRLPTAVPVFEAILTPSTLACLGDHRVHGAPVVAGPVFLELAQAAAHEVDGEALRVIEQFVIQAPLALPATGRVVQTCLSEDVNGGRTFTIHSRDVDRPHEWRLHAHGRLAQTDRVAAVAGAHVLALSATKDALGRSASCEPYYERLLSVGIALGPACRSLVHAHRIDGQALAEIALPDGANTDSVTWAHPALLDGAFQAVGMAIPRVADGTTYLLAGVDRIALAEPLPAHLWCHAMLHEPGDLTPPEWQADVTLRSLEGRVLGVLQGVRLHRASPDALARAAGCGGSADLFYRVEWQPAPPVVSAASRLASPDSFVPHLRERFTALAQQHGLSIYDHLLPSLDRISAAYVAAALSTLGFDDAPGRVFDAAGERQRLDVHARHGRLFARALDILAEDGLLHRHATGFTTTGKLAAAAALVARSEGDSDAPVAEVRMLGRCGPALARVLRGEQDPVQLLFPDGSFREARALYVESPFAQTYNRALGEMLVAALATRDPDARIRVLEIGAGTGGTTEFVLPVLPAQRVDYTFTDLSPLFLERAAEQFAAFPFLKRQVLDIEQHPQTQAFAASSYDIVIAANVLHATADLRRALEHVKWLMAPGAMLLMLEGVAPERWVDLTFGLTEGWWRFTDGEWRSRYPLIGRDAWLDLLRSTGFVSAAALPEAPATTRAASQHAILVARNPLHGRQWTIVGGRKLGAALAAKLNARGDDAAVVTTDAVDTAIGPPANVVYLGAQELASQSIDAPAAADAAHRLACEEPLRWLKASVAGHGRIWLVTQGAQDQAGSTMPGAVWQAPMWGLGRGFALEHPARWGGLIDLPDGDPETLAATLVEALDATDPEDQTAWRDGRRLAARLLHAPAPPGRATRFPGDRTFLVTGGFGGLGLVVARWLVEHGARNIALLGRRRYPEAEGVRAIEALGARVWSFEADVADEEAMSRVFARLRAESPPLSGVLHAAADLSAAPIADLTGMQVRAMLRPKVHGGLVLERLTRESALEFLVLFSSTTALLGATGLAHYAAANAFLDALAAATDGPRRRVVSVNWGTWDVMRLATDESRRQYREGGLLPMSAAEACDALGRVLADPRPHAIVASIDWGVLKPLHEARRRRPLLAELAEQRQPTIRTPRAGADPTLTVRLGDAPASLRRDLLIEFVQQEVAAVLGTVTPSAVPVSTGLFDLGMDSLMAVELKRRLERGVGKPLPATLTFNYPNVGALAGYIDTLLTVSKSPMASGGPLTAAVDNPRSAGTDDADLDSLTDDELEARLRVRLEQTR
jgi:acyl transferase domain-containing protein/acyl carrier protein